MKENDQKIIAKTTAPYVFNLLFNALAIGSLIISGLRI
jgi:hypothetical protein